MRITHKKSILTLSILAMTSVIAACGGDSTGPGGTIATQQGQFVDSAVAGLRYDAGEGITGVTDADGMFRYRVGHEISFFIGDTLFGTADGTQIITPADLARNDNASNGINSPALINRLRLLQALDLDGDPENDITLPENVQLPGITSLNYALDLVNFVAQPVVGSLLNIVGRTDTDVPSDAQALAHFENYALTNLYQGCYVGQIRDVGPLALKVRPDGTINGLVTVVADNPQVPVTGTIRGDGTIFFGPTGATTEYVGRVGPVRGQAIGYFEGETTEHFGGLLMRNPLQFPSFDVTPCAAL